MTIGAELKRIRAANKISQKDLAALMGVGLPRYKKWEERAGGAHSDGLETLLSFFKITKIEELENVAKVGLDGTIGHQTPPAKSSRPSPSVSQHDELQAQYIALAQSSQEKMDKLIQAVMKSNEATMKAVGNSDQLAMQALSFIVPLQDSLQVQKTLTETTRRFLIEEIGAIRDGGDYSRTAERFDQMQQQVEQEFARTEVSRLVAAQ